MGGFDDHMGRASRFALSVTQSAVLIDGVSVMAGVDTTASEPSVRVGGRTSGLSLVLYIDRDVWTANGFKKGSIVEYGCYGRTTVKVIQDDGDPVLVIHCETVKTGVSF